MAWRPKRKQNENLHLRIGLRRPLSRQDYPVLECLSIDAGYRTPRSGGVTLYRCLSPARPSCAIGVGRIDDGLRVGQNRSDASARRRTSQPRPNDAGGDQQPRHRHLDPRPSRHFLPDQMPQRGRVHGAYQRPGPTPLDVSDRAEDPNGARRRSGGSVRCAFAVHRCRVRGPSRLEWRGASDAPALDEVPARRYRIASIPSALPVHRSEPLRSVLEVLVESSRGGGMCVAISSW